MKFIELTLMTEQKVFLNANVVESFVWQGDYTGIGLPDSGTMRVKESPEQIIELINDNQKKSGVK